MRQPGIEPGPTAWKAAILTFRLLSQLNIFYSIHNYKYKYIYKLIINIIYIKLFIIIK